MQSVVVQVINMAFGNKDGIEAKLEKELLKRANSKKDYNRMDDEICRLRELKKNDLVSRAER